ncbi:hypothetical protein ES703_14660 [subsurface metagenome]
MRPEDSSDADKIAAGVLKSMQLTGYDYPIRKLRRSGDVRCVTLPLQVRGFLALERGDWLVFGATLWPGVAGFVKVLDEQYRSMTNADRKAQQLTARKVQAKKAALFVNIPPKICEILAADIGDLLHFSPRSAQNVVDISAVKGGGESHGSRRSG